MSRPPGRLWSHPDVLVALCLLGLCGLVYWRTTTFREVPAMLSQNVPPTFFPRLVLTAVAIMSAALLVKGLFRRDVEAREPIPGTVYATAALVAVAIALVPRLGTFATIALIGFGMPVLWGERRPWRVALLAVALPSSIYALFVLALGMRFPSGLLF